jgi:hypothetical protein
MGCAPVQFDYNRWVQTFPELAAVVQPRAQLYFDLSAIMWRNDGTGPVSNPATQLNLLNLLTAHLATTYTQGLGDPSPGAPKDANGPVGRISNATEGSVSIATDYGTSIPQQMAFLIQTRYGATFWALTAQYRTARYMPGTLQAGGLGRGFGGAVYAPL